MNIAMHAVMPLCACCGRQVRSSVELRAEWAELRREADALSLRQHAAEVLSLEEAAEYDAKWGELQMRLKSLKTELGGSHLVCAGALH